MKMMVVVVVVFFVILLMSPSYIRENMASLGWGWGWPRPPYGMPVWQSTRFTRNQSYDLRGDPFRISPSYPLVWNVSSWAF